MIAILLAVVCVCPASPRIDWSAIDAAMAEAARKTDREVALRKLQAELDEVLRRTRAEFERRR